MPSGTIITQCRSWPRILLVAGAILSGLVHVAPAHAQTRLSARVVSEDHMLGQPREITTWADQLLVRDGLRDPWFHLIDPTRGILSSFGREGDGPGEYDGPTRMNRAGDTNGIWIVDVTKRRFTLLTISGSNPEVAATLNLTGAAMAPTNLLPVGDTAFLVTGLVFPGGHDSRFISTDRAGRFVRAVGPRLNGNAAVPFTERAKADQANARLSPSGTRIAVSYSYRSKVGIYDVNGRQLADCEVPPDDRFVTEFIQSGPPNRARWVWAATETTRYGYHDLAVTDDFIFALYSGKNIYDGSHSSRVHVFDWSGRFVDELIFDRLAISIAVTDQGDKLFSTGFKPIPGVYAYDLPPRFGTNARSLTPHPHH
jgi:hypothetical protein